MGLFSSKSDPNKAFNKLLKKWGQTIPTAQALTDTWPKLPDELKQQAGILAAEGQWPAKYLLECSTNDKAYQAFLDLWPYQENSQEELLKLLNKELGVPNPSHSLAVAGLIKELKDKRIMAYLLEDLLGKEGYLPSRVCDCLAVFGNASGQALAFLYPKLETKKQLLVLDALGLLTSYCPLEVLQTAMASPDSDIKKRAAQTIAAVKPPNPVTFMAPLLKDKDPQVRAAAANALSEIGGKEAVLTIKEMFKTDEDWLVKMTCQAFISRFEAEIKKNIQADEADLWLK